MRPESSGACLIMEIPGSQFTHAWMDQLMDHIFKIEGGLMNPYQIESWKSDPELRHEMVDNVISRKFITTLTSDWSRAGVYRPSIMDKRQYVISGSNEHKFPEKGNVWLSINAYHSGLDASNTEHVKTLVGRYQSLVDFANPTYAFIDHMQKNVRKRINEDPRQFGWGAMYFSTAMAEKIGHELIDKCSAEELEFVENGIWVFPTLNPWTSDGRIKNKIAKELNLETL